MKFAANLKLNMGLNPSIVISWDTYFLIDMFLVTIAINVAFI